MGCTSSKSIGHGRPINAFRLDDSLRVMLKRSRKREGSTEYRPRAPHPILAKEDENDTENVYSSLKTTPTVVDAGSSCHTDADSTHVDDDDDDGDSFIPANNKSAYHKKSISRNSNTTISYRKHLIITED